jgi:IS5 family transposase
MTNQYSWQEKYEAAVLETDRKQLMARIITAQNAIDSRLREIQADHGGTPEERQSLAIAMEGLRMLRDGVS